jgi:3-hydroxybutyryl-CoA dehydrogenase
MRSPDELTRAPRTTVAILGLGTMGQGIALVCARAGLEARVFDVRPEQGVFAHAAMGATLRGLVERKKLSAEDMQTIFARIHLSARVEDACAGVDFVIEAIVESLEQKAALLSQVKSAAPPFAILATNTSALSITELGEKVGAAERVLGLHFFNPATSMELLEVVRGARTSPENVARALEFARAIGKTPIVVRDSPGFATSRLGVVLAVEAMRVLEEGVAGVADIDRAMELGYRHPMGPFKVTDLVGLDVRLAIVEHLSRELGERFRPPAILTKLVTLGRLGKKVGVGFYRWTDGGPVPEPWE